MIGRFKGCKINDICEWIKKHKILVITISVIILGLGIPILINYAYVIDGPFKTLWYANDVLTFYGSLLGFIGTVSLSGLALWQNTQLKNKDTDMTNANTLTPYFIVEEVNLKCKGEEFNLELIRSSYTYQEIEDEENVEVSIVLKNVGNGPAITQMMVPGIGKRPTDKQYIDVKDTFNYVFRKKLSVKNYGNRDKDIIVKYENMLGYRYEQVIKLDFNIDQCYSEENLTHSLSIAMIGPQNRIGMLSK